MAQTSRFILTGEVDLGARLRSTVEFGRQHYSASVWRDGWTGVRQEREDAFKLAVELLPASARVAVKATHAGYYGSMNPLVMALGWTRGPPQTEEDAALPNPPPEQQLDLGCPSYGDEYTHIAELHGLGVRMLQGLAKTRSDLRDFAPEDLAHAGASSVQFSNVTPYQAERGVDPVREHWSAFYPMFRDVFVAARPLVLVSVGRIVVRRFCVNAFPEVLRLPAQPFPRDAPGGKRYSRRWGLIRVEGIPTGYLELPVHPSLGYYGAYRENAGSLAATLANEALNARST